MNENILIIDDEKEIQNSLSAILQDDGYNTLTAGTGKDGLRIIQEEPVNLILLDLFLPDTDGVEVLRQIKSIDSSLAVIMISGNATVEAAVESTKLGAYYFIEKPFEPIERIDYMLLTIKRALEHQQLQRENLALKKKESSKYTMVGKSPAIMRLYDQISKAAPSKGRVLITGENGSGKELVARAIHQQSKRASKPFVEVNCAAIPQELIESEIFGHEKGSFTGASRRQIGKFELSNGGTIFLDEIGDMSLTAQAKVLRALEEEKIQRIGGTGTIDLDVRVIAATNKNLEEEIEKGNFRQDLFYRLNVIPIVVPPLRERKEDIPLLVNHFVHQFCSENGKPVKELEPEAINILKQHDWPGNVRELRNIAERLVIMVDSDTIAAANVLSAVHINTHTPYSEGPKSLRDMVDEYEKNIVVMELDATDHNVSQTAKNLNVDRANLYRKLRSWGIVKSDN
ncbi:response regulator [Candidatus Poribacteria bacterium]|nr:response regulator [Candidatus Poribacteria bacterium]